MQAPLLENPIPAISRAKLLTTLLAILVPCFLASLLLLRRTLRAHKTFKTVRARKAAASDRVLLIGPSGAGKTSLWAAWTSAQPPSAANVRGKGAEAAVATVPSLRSTKAPFAPAESPLARALPRADLVDLPGHPKLVRETQEQLAASGTRAIVFLLDASTGTEALAESAPALYEALVVAEQRRIPLLIAANKNDLFNTTAPRRIKALLQSAIDEQRTVRARKVAGSGDNDFGDEDEDEWIGHTDVPFAFEQLTAPFALLEGSVKDGRTKRWAEWIAKRVEN